MKSRLLDAWGWIFLAIGAGAVANALWMLLGPLHWYTTLPAEVPDTGPFNAHFVRDIGCAFLAIGLALVWAAFTTRFRLPLVAVSTLFMVAHAALHLFDTLGGALDHHHLWLDLLPVYVPAVLMLFAVAGLARQERS